MRSDIQRALSGYPVGAQLHQTSSYAAGPSTRRYDPMGQTQLQGGPTGAIPPYEYGPADTTGGRNGNRRRKRPIWPWITGLVALIVIAALILAFETINGHTPPSGVSVPNVVGKKLSAAETALQNHGFKVKTSPHTSSTGPYNVVTRTSPAATQLEPRGSSVTVFYNVPPGAKALPSVKGLSEAAAVALLNKDGWKNVNPSSSEKASVTIAQGHVVSTDPAAGNRVSLNTPILLNLSGGGTKVPSVYDLQQADAEAALHGDNLVVAIVNNVPGPPCRRRQGPCGRRSLRLARWYCRVRQ